MSKKDRLDAIEARLDALEVEQEKHCHLLSKVFPERTEDDIWCKDPEQSDPGEECDYCGGIGILDSGGQNPDGTWINVPCPCRDKKPKDPDDKEWKQVYREALVKASPAHNGAKIDYLNAPLVIAAKIVVEERKRADWMEKLLRQCTDLEKKAKGE